jgi:hypothetical protein
VCSSGVPRHIFRGGGVRPGIFSGGFNKLNWGQRAERMEIWGRLPPSEGFHSICEWVKPVFWLGCYGCIFHGTGNLARLCQNFGIPGEFTPPNPLVTPLVCSRPFSLDLCYVHSMTFAERWNRLKTHLSECIPVVKRHMTVLATTSC